MSSFKTSNVLFFGLLLALFCQMGSMVNATDPYVNPTRGTLIINATCEGIDFAKLSVKEGIVAANRLKVSFNSISSKAGHEIIRKLLFSGPSYTPGSIRASSKVGLFTGTWLKEEAYADTADIFFLRDGDTGIDTRTAPIRSPRVQAWLEALLETWENTFVFELLTTGRPGFFRAQRCSLRYVVKMY